MFLEFHSGIEATNLFAACRVLSAFRRLLSIVRFSKLMLSHTIPSSPMTRRHLLRQVFAYSAVAALAGRIPTFGAPLANEEGLHFLMLGDFGNSRKYRITKEGAKPSANDGDPNAPSMQTQVATAMQQYVRMRGITPEGLFMLGDNFYGTMEGGVASPRWKEGFEDMYPAEVFPGPCWATTITTKKTSIKWRRNFPMPMPTRTHAGGCPPNGIGSITPRRTR
jgi:hypothetical protein